MGNEQISIAIDLGKHVDGVQEHIIREATAVLVERIEDEVSGRIAKAIEAKVMEKVDGRLEGMLEDFFTTPRLETNRWGEPRGEPKTFGERAANRIEALLEQKVRPSDGIRDQSWADKNTMLRSEWLAWSVARDAVAKQLGPEIAKAAEKARDAITANCAELVKEIVGGLLKPKRRG